jgi:hypothetical protein
MSVKAQALVWDLKCPDKIHGKEFKPSHKYVLVCYADHADHNGKNIWPSVHTIHGKTGLDERSVQRLTHDLKEMGLLVEDGSGPRGTNRWKLPFTEGGDKLSPRQNVTGDKLPGDKKAKSLGDIPSGDIPSGDNLSPELKELNQEDINNISIEFFNTWVAFKERARTNFKKAQYDTWIAHTEAVSFENLTLTVMAGNEYNRNWLETNLQDLAQVDLGVYVEFVIPEPEGVQ